MSFAHLLTETCYVEDAVLDSDGCVVLDGDGQVTYTGITRQLVCSHLRRQRVFRTQGSTGSAGERISAHQIVTAEKIEEDARVWYPGADSDDVSQALTPIELEHQTRPYGGLTLFHTYL